MNSSTWVAATTNFQPMYDIEIEEGINYSSPFHDKSKEGLSVNGSLFATSTV